MRFLKPKWFKHIFIIIALLIGFIKCMSNQESKDTTKSDSLITEILLDSNKLYPFYDPKFRYYSYDTIIKAHSNEYKIKTKKREYKLFIEIFKNNEKCFFDSTEVYGPFSVNLENFNGDDYPDLRIDYRDNKNTITLLYLWNTESSKFLYLDEYHDITLIRPKYFMSFNIFGAEKYGYAFYKINNNNKILLLKSFYIDYNSENEKGSYVQTDGLTIYTDNDIDSCYKIVENFKMKIKDAL